MQRPDVNAPLAAILRALAVVLSCLSLAACASTPPAPGASEAPVFVLPFHLDENGRPVAEVTVDGRGPLDFILDTASTTTALFEHAVHGTPDNTKRISVLGVGGVARRPAIRIRSLRLSSYEAGAIDAVVLDDTIADHGDGVIGLDLLTRFFVLFDCDRNEVLFFDPQTPPRARLGGWLHTPMRAETFGLSSRPVFLIEGRVAGAPFPMLIDTGLEVTLGNEALMRRLPTVPRPPSRRAKTEIKGATVGETQSYIVFFATLSAGRIKWPNGSLYIAPAQLFVDLGYADDPFAAIGFDLLGKRPFAMDFANLIFYAPPLPAGGAMGAAPSAAAGG